MKKTQEQETLRQREIAELVKSALFALLRHETRGEEIAEPVKGSLGDVEVVKELYKLSKAHDLAHLIADALFKNKLLDKQSPAGQAFSRVLQTAVFRYEQIRYELESACSALSEAKIPHLPLKGSVIRALYPQAWMRTSCDIDMYVDEARLDEATDVLVQKLGYRNEGRTPHDMNMYAPSGVHFELHFDLIEDEIYPKFAKPLLGLWENASPICEGGFTYRATNEDFYFYHIAHTAKHLRNGGCGVRAFIDLWYLEKSLPYDKEKVAALLEESGLTKFAEVARKLARVWFDGEEHDELSKETEAFILQGGIYGVFENTLAVQVSKGRVAYLFSRFFPPYREMVRKYPSLKKCPVLYPFYIVRRWFNLLLVKGRAKNSVKEFNLAMEKAKEKRSTRLLKNLELHVEDLKKE